MNFHYSHWKKTEISLSETRIFIEFFIMIKFIIEGVLPDSESKVTEVFGSLDIYNEEGTLFADSDKKIEKDFSPSVFSKSKSKLTLPF